MDTSLKTCFKCGIAKARTEFYRHPQMGDGLLGKCKECTKKDTRKQEIKLMCDPAKWEKELERHREKRRRYVAEGRAKEVSLERKRAKNRKHAERHPLAAKARAAVAKAVNKGVMVAAPCTVCGYPKTDAHHPDYSKPLDVVWLCRKHHAEADVERRARMLREESKADRLFRVVVAAFRRRNYLPDTFTVSVPMSERLELEQTKVHQP